MSQLVEILLGRKLYECQQNVARTFNQATLQVSALPLSLSLSEQVFLITTAGALDKADTSNGIEKLTKLSTAGKAAWTLIRRPNIGINIDINMH